MTNIEHIGPGGPVASVRAVAAATAPLPPTPARVELYDASTGRQRKLTPGTPAFDGDAVAREAYDNATQVSSFLHDKLGRNGWDDKGSALELVVHTKNDKGGPLNNAYWNGARIHLGDGDGKVFAPLGGALDVMTHEAMHAVVDSEVNLRYKGQQGALNESWADVLAAWHDGGSWKIGEDVFTPGRDGDSIRDLTKPRFGHTRSLPPGAEIDVYNLAGIPSLAAVKVAERIGTDDMGRIWYSALTDHLDSRAGFAGAARATLDAAHVLYGAGSQQFQAVNDAWKAVGVRSRWKSFGAG